jgi:hypothetical protein
VRTFRDFSVAVLVLSVEVASAQDAAQKIDGTKYCDAMAGMFNSSTGVQKMMRDNCFGNEADYAAKLTRVWPKVPEADRETAVRSFSTRA